MVTPTDDQPYHPNSDRPSDLDDDDMPAEYDFSKFPPGVRGKYAEAMQRGYSVTVHHQDGTSTTQQFPGLIL